MSFIQNIKNNIRKNIIVKSKKANNRIKEFHNIETAKHIGILFDTLDLDNYAYIKDIVKGLKSKGKKIQALGWVDNDKSPDFPLAGDIAIYNNSQVKWTGKAKEAYISEFSKQDFDIMFVLTYSDSPSIEYIKNVSKARCKIGQESDNCESLDFIIKLKDNINVKTLFLESDKMLKQFSKAK